MPLQGIRFDVAGDVFYSRAFEAAADEVSDLREPLTEIGDQLLRSIGEQFRSEGAHGSGSKWKPLSPAYEEWKRQQVGDEPLMVFTGSLRAAMMARSAVRVEPRRLVYEPGVPGWAIRHHKGDPGGQPMPQRRLVELPDSDRRGWDRAFATWLNSIRREKLAGL